MPDAVLDRCRNALYGIDLTQAGADGEGLFGHHEGRSFLGGRFGCYLFWAVDCCWTVDCVSTEELVSRSASFSKSRAVSVATKIVARAAIQ